MKKHSMSKIQSIFLGWSAAAFDARELLLHGLAGPTLIAIAVLLSPGFWAADGCYLGVEKPHAALRVIPGSDKIPAAEYRLGALTGNPFWRCQSLLASGLYAFMHGMGASDRWKQCLTIWQHATGVWHYPERSGMRPSACVAFGMRRGNCSGMAFGSILPPARGMGRAGISPAREYWELDRLFRDLSEPFAAGPPLPTKYLSARVEGPLVGALRPRNATAVCRSNCCVGPEIIANQEHNYEQTLQTLSPIDGSSVYVERPLGDEEQIERRADLAR